MIMHPNAMKINKTALDENPREYTTAIEDALIQLYYDFPYTQFFQLEYKMCYIPIAGRREFKQSPAYDSNWLVELTSKAKEQYDAQTNP